MHKHNYFYRIPRLEARIWKCICIKLATSLLLDVPAYQSQTQETIKFQLARAFVPNISQFKMFTVNEMMEDIILIEGISIDYNTRECYSAPVYIPRYE